jgi:hypothetical protein
MSRGVGAPVGKDHDVLITTSTEMSVTDRIVTGTGVGIATTIVIEGPCPQ